MTTINPVMTCGCGKPTRYMVGGGEFACNKYFRCAESQSDVRVETWATTLNKLLMDAGRYNKLKAMLSNADDVEKMLIISSSDIDYLVDITNVDGYTPSYTNQTGESV